MENTHIKIGSRVIPLEIKHSKRAKHISLRISPAKNSIIMTLPRYATVTSGMKFLAGKTDWILANVEEYKNVRIMAGITLPILGKNYTVRRMDGRGTTKMDAQNGELIVFCAPEFTSRRVKDFLKKYLREKCVRRSQALAERIGKTVSKITISSARSHWGNCNSKRAISFNWLLVFSPPEILEYIIAHEVAHLKEMNHSPRFWQVVKDLCPGMLASRKWLKEQGYKLHRYE